jgi:hypothetical protein
MLPIAALAAVMAALLLAAPAALATDGKGLAGSADDKMVTLFCLGLIVFFPVLVTALSLIQGRLDARKERRRYDLERLEQS